MKISSPRMDFLLAQNPDILREQHAFMAGESVQFGKPDSKKLHVAVLEHHRKGQETLQDFRKWLIKTRGVTLSTAKNHTGRVWDALCFTFDVTASKSRVWQVLDDMRYSHATVQNYRSALKHWANYSQDAEVMTQLTLRSSRGRKSLVMQAPRASATPYAKKDIRKLLRNVDKLKDDPRYPWAWPILRVVILTGMTPTDVVWVDKHRLETCFTANTLEIWSRTRGSQKIPLGLIEDEIRMLLAIPWRWETLADLICPTSGKHGRTRGASLALRARMKDVFLAAKLHRDRNWVHRLRLTAARAYYKQTKSLVAAGQILGLRDINEVRLRLEI